HHQPLPHSHGHVPTVRAPLHKAGALIIHGTEVRAHGVRAGGSNATSKRLCRPDVPFLRCLPPLCCVRALEKMDLSSFDSPPHKGCKLYGKACAPVERRPFRNSLPRTFFNRAVFGNPARPRCHSRPYRSPAKHHPTLRRFFFLQASTSLLLGVLCCAARCALWHS
ncbi:unnamed protein product, partial [Ectocarpus sp. 12 AP-2014]